MQRTTRRLKLTNNKFGNKFENFEDAAKQRFEDIRGNVRNGVRFTRNAARSVDRYSHRNPWMVVGAFAFAAWIVGFFSGVRRMAHFYKDE